MCVCICPLLAENHKVLFPSLIFNIKILPTVKKKLTQLIPVFWVNGMISSLIKNILPLFIFRFPGNKMLVKSSVLFTD